MSSSSTREIDANEEWHWHYHIISRRGIESLRVESANPEASAPLNLILWHILRDIRLEGQYLMAKREAVQTKFERGEIQHDFFRAEIHFVNRRERVLGARLYRYQRVKYRIELPNAQHRILTEGDKVEQSLNKLLFFDSRDPANSYLTADWTKINTILQGKRGPRSDGTVWADFKDDTATIPMILMELVQIDIPPELIDWVCGASTSSRRASADNCIRVPSAISGYVERGDLVILPSDPCDEAPTRFRFVLVNTKVKDYKPIPGCDLTLAQLDGEEMLFATDERPALSFVYLQFVAILAARRLYRWGNLRDRYVELGNLYPFSTLRKYLRESFLIQLGSCGIASFLGWPEHPAWVKVTQQTENTAIVPCSSEEIVVNLFLYHERILRDGRKSDPQALGYHSRLDYGRQLSPRELVLELLGDVGRDEEDIPCAHLERHA